MKKALNGKHNQKTQSTAIRIKKMLLPQKRRYTKKLLLRIFYCSIIISLCVLIVTVMVLYSSFESIVTKEIHKNSIQLLTQTQSIFSSLHAWIMSSIQQIQSEDEIRYLMYSDNLDKLKMSNAIDRLDEIMASYYLLHSIYIYNHKTKQYFSTINGYEGDECSDFTLSSIIHNIRDYGIYKYLPRKITFTLYDRVFRQDLEKVQTVNVFSVVAGNIPVYGPTIKGAIIINISEEKIRNNFLAADPNSSGLLLIIDNKGTILTHADENKFGVDFSQYSYVQRIINSQLDRDVFTDTIDNEKYLISYVTHPLWNWRFINIMPYNKIFSNLNEFSKITIIAFVLLMLLAILSALVSSIRIYSPIHKLFQYSLQLKDNLKIQELSENGNRISELQYLDRVFKQIVKKADAFDSYLKEQKALYRHEALKGLLLGELDPDELEKYWGYINKDIESGPFIIAILRMDRFDYILKMLDNEEISKLYNIIRELVSHYITVNKIFLNMGKDHACIICNLQSNSTNKEEVWEKIKTSLKVIQTAIKRQLKYTITIGLSDIFPSYSEFHEKYENTLQATQFRFRYGHNALISFKDLNKSTNHNYIFPDEKIRILLNEIKLGKMPKAGQLLNDILKEVKEYGYEDYTYLVQFLSYHINKTIEQTKQKLKQSYIKLKNLLQGIKSAETTEEVKKKFIECFNIINEHLQVKQNQKAFELAAKIKDYINKNYTSPVICSDNISGIMGFSTYYIRFTFKKIFGISISEYINTLRLDYCRDQLLATKLPVKKIYKAAGFYNYSYFFTLFKKNTGLTPNQYRFQKKEIKKPQN